MMAKSIINNQKRCFRCGKGDQQGDIHKHHIYAGAFRAKSEKWGCWVYLCRDHHTGNHGVHTRKGSDYWLHLKKLAQVEFEKRHGHDLFMQEFRRNWLTEEEEK